MVGIRLGRTGPGESRFGCSFPVTRETSHVGTQVKLVSVARLCLSGVRQVGRLKINAEATVNNGLWAFVFKLSRKRSNTTAVLASVLFIL